MKTPMTDWQLPQQGLFVTGTDTEVGKTWVSTHILRTLRPLTAQTASKSTPEKVENFAGKNFRGTPLICARKPVASGATQVGEHLLSEDTQLLAHASGEPTHQVTRFQLAPPISPARAAQETGLDTRLPRLLEACKAPPNSWTLVEGAGGFLSPLGADNTLNADLAKALNLPVLLVVGLKLGCINHTLLTLEAIHHRGLYCIGVVINDLTGQGDKQTVSELRTLIDPPLYAMPHGQPNSDWPQWLASLQLMGEKRQTQMRDNM